MFDKFLFGNKQIPEMYFGNIPVAQIYFGNTLIWEKASKVLLAQNDDVAIEYVPSANEEIEHISCFFNPTNDNAEIRFKIFHESGLIVAQVTADSVDSQVTELYGLQGQKRTVTLNPKLTLRAGERYYIQYTCSDQGTRIKPAYFQNKTGNYKSSCRVTDSKSVADISNLDDYLGYLTTINSFMTSDEDSFMVWNTDNSYNGKLNKGTVYIRNNEACLSYYGDLGESSFGPSDRTAIAGMSIGEVFRWTGYNGDLTQYNFYRKKKATKEPYTSVTFSNYNNNVDRIAILLYDASLKDTTVTPNKEGVLTNDYIWHSYDTIAGKLWTLKSGYSFDYDSSLNRRTSLPDTPVNNRFYLFNNANGKTGLYLYDENYSSDHYRLINEYSQGQTTEPDYILYYIVEDDIMDALTSIGQADSFIKTTFDSYYYSNTFRQATLETTKKFYLEIDRREV